jgi:hypothetical protein
MFHLSLSAKKFVASMGCQEACDWFVLLAVIIKPIRACLVACICSLALATFGEAEYQILWSSQTLPPQESADEKDKR